MTRTAWAALTTVAVLASVAGLVFLYSIASDTILRSLQIEPWDEYPTGPAD